MDEIAINVKVPLSDYKKIKADADREDRSLASIMRRIIADYFERREAKGAA